MFFHVYFFLLGLLLEKLAAPVGDRVHELLGFDNVFVDNALLANHKNDRDSTIGFFEGRGLA